MVRLLGKSGLAVLVSDARPAASAEAADAAGHGPVAAFTWPNMVVLAGSVLEAPSVNAAPASTE